MYFSCRKLYKTRACADFPNVVTQRHIFGGAHPGGDYDPTFELGRDLYHASTPKFHHPMFTRSEVIVLTNKHANKQANRRR